MRRIIHERLGDPLSVLKLVDGSGPIDVQDDEVLLRVTYTPIHPGDLLLIEGSPASGEPDVPAGGRTPGFEGAGIVERVGCGVDPSLDIHVGDRVAFFPAASVWSDQVAVSAGSIVKLPDGISDQIGSHMLINVITASMLIRAGHNSIPADKLKNVTVLQTAAGSAVGRLLTTMLSSAGVSPIRLVGGEAGAEILRDLHLGVPVIATQDPDWKSKLLETIGGREIHVALDGVGGDLLADITEFMAVGSTIISYGSLGGPSADIRSIVPRQLSIRGLTMGAWVDEPAEIKAKDIAAAIDLARSSPELFAIAGEYSPEHLWDAIGHVGRRGKIGTVLLRFS